MNFTKQEKYDICRLFDYLFSLKEEYEILNRLYRLHDEKKSNEALFMLEAICNYHHISFQFLLMYFNDKIPFEVYEIFAKEIGYKEYYQ